MISVKVNLIILLANIAFFYVEILAGRKQTKLEDFQSTVTVYKDSNPFIFHRVGMRCIISCDSLNV